LLFAAMLCAKNQLKIHQIINKSSALSAVALGKINGVALVQGYQGHHGVKQ